MNHAGWSERQGLRKSNAAHGAVSFRHPLADRLCESFPTAKLTLSVFEKLVEIGGRPNVLVNVLIDHPRSRSNTLCLRGK